MIHSLQIHGIISSDTNAIQKITTSFPDYPGNLLQPDVKRQVRSQVSTDLYLGSEIYTVHEILEEKYEMQF